MGICSSPSKELESKSSIEIEKTNIFVHFLKRDMF